MDSNCLVKFAILLSIYYTFSSTVLNILVMIIIMLLLFTFILWVDSDYIPIIYLFFFILKKFSLLVFLMIFIKLWILFIKNDRLYRLQFMLLPAKKVHTPHYKMDTEVNPLNAVFLIVKNLPFREHLAICRNIFGCYTKKMLLAPSK